MFNYGAVDTALGKVDGNKCQFSPRSLCPSYRGLLQKLNPPILSWSIYTKNLILWQFYEEI